MALAAVALLLFTPAPAVSQEETPIAAEDPSAAEEGLILTYHGTLLSADIDDKPLPDVVAALAEQMPLKVYMRESAQKEIDGRRIFARFEGRRLQAGLREIFEGLDFILKDARRTSQDGDVDAAGGSLEIWFYRGTGAYAELAGATEPAKIDPPSILAGLGPERERLDLPELTEEELRDLAKNASSDDLRALSLIELGNRVENPDNVNAFVEALEADESKTVRWRALTQILGVRQDLSDDVYRRAIREDPDPFLRKQALAVAVFRLRHDAEGLLAEVRAGRDEKLSAYAEELLEWLAQQPPATTP